MKRKLLNLLMVIILLLVSIPGILLLASDISGALYKMSIVVSNNGTLVNYVATNTVVSTNSGWISTPNLIAGGFLNSSANNCAVLDSAANDVVFMPGYSTNPWAFWVETIGSDSYLNYDLYTANTTGGEIAYFPGTTGMIVSDNGTLELGDDFDIELEGWVDTESSGHLVSKLGAFSITNTAAEEISGIIFADEPVELVPSGYNAWTDVDITANVPASATGAVVHLTNTAGAARDVGVRMNGSGDDLKGNLQTHGWTIVGIDASDILELFLQDNNCHAYLVGFTGVDFTFKAAADDISLVGAMAWIDIDLSVEAPSATGAIIVVDNTDAQKREWGVQKNGSGDNRFADTATTGISWAVIGLDGAQKLEGYVENVLVDFYLVGYITGNVTLLTNGIDKSLAAGFGAWTDVDCSGDTTGSTTHIIFQVDCGAGGKNYGFRKNGGAENIHPDGTDHFWAVVECDDSQIIEGWAEDVNVDWWIIGYTEGYVDNPYEVSVSAVNQASDEYNVLVSANTTHLAISIDGAGAGDGYDSTALGGASVDDNDSDWAFFLNDAVPYMLSANIVVAGNSSAWIWEYDTTFYDSIGANDATPSFLTASSDVDVVAKAVSFQPIEEAKAPPWTLDETAATWLTAGNVSGNFTTTPSPTYPGADVIEDIAAASGTPAQLPFIMIFGFITLAISLAVSYVLRQYGSRSLFVKVIVIGSLLLIFETVGVIDMWMLVFFLIIALAIMAASKPGEVI